MEATGLQSVGNIFFGNSLITNQPLTVEDKTAQPLDRYVPARASVGADHESLKAVGSPSHTAVTKKIEEIANNSSLTDKEKRAQINELRKQLGLSKGDMKKFFTKPLERSYAQKIDQLKATGIDSPEKQRLLEQLESKKKLYGSMYKAGGCVKKVFKGIGKGLAMVGKVALGVVTAIANPASLIPMAASLIGKIPGVGKVVNTVSGALSKAKGYVDGVIDKATGWVEKGVGYVNRGVQFYREASELPKRWWDEAKNLPWF